MIQVMAELDLQASYLCTSFTIRQQAFVNYLLPNIHTSAVTKKDALMYYMPNCHHRMKIVRLFEYLSHIKCLHALSTQQKLAGHHCHPLVIPPEAAFIVFTSDFVTR